MFSKRVKHYHQWLRTTVPFKAKLGQISSDSVRVLGPAKRPSLGHLYPVSPVQERNRKGGKCKISRVLQSPVPSTQASPKVEASHRPQQAQYFSTRRKVQNGNSRVHQDLPDSRGVGIVDRSVGRLPTHPHPPKLKEIPKVLLQGSGVPVDLPPIRTSHSPQVFTMIVKEVKLMALSRGLRIHQYLDDWLIRSQSQEEAQVNTQAMVDLTQSLGWIINQEKSELKPTPVFSFVGYEYYLNSALVKPTQERWLKLQDLILLLKSKRVLTARCLMSLIGLLASTEKMVPEGRLHMRPFQFHLKEHWRYPQSLDSLLPWTEAIVAHLDWWQNPSNVMKCADLHPKDHSIQLFTDASNEGWGAHLDQNSTKGLWSDREKRLHINVLELKAISLALRDFKDQCQNQTVLVATDNSTVVAYINKQGGTHSAEMCALLWKIMTWCHPAVQVQPSIVNRMVSASAGVQTDLPEVVHTSCRLICHSSEPQTSTVRISYPRPKGLGHRCSKHKLDEPHGLCLGSYGSPSQGDPKDQAMPLPDHRNGPRLARDALVLGPSAALNRDPTSTPSVNDPTQTVPIVCVPQQPTAAEPPRLVSRSRQLQEQGFSGGGRENCCAKASAVINKDHLQVKVGPI